MIQILMCAFVEKWWIHQWRALSNARGYLAQYDGQAHKQLKNDMTNLKITIQYHMACIGDMLPENWTCEVYEASVPTWGGKRG